MKRAITVASATAVLVLTAAPGTASACDPNSPTCGHGNVVENVVDWTEWRANEIGRHVDRFRDRIAFDCSVVCP